MKKKLTVITFIVALVLIFILVGISAFIGIQVFAGSTQLVTNEETFGISELFLEKYNIDYENFCKTYQIDKVDLVSSLDGHTIPADYIFAQGTEKNNRTVVLVHGLGGNRYSNYPLAEMFLEKGYNVLSYDQRSTNENTSQYTTFGYLEKYDLIDCINFLKKEAPEQILGVWGTSFGGATAGLALGYEDTEEKVDFLILDCPVSSMEWMVEEEMKNMDIGIPISYMTWCGNLVNKIKLGFNYKDADVSTALQDISIPVLIINSKADTITPYFMGKGIFDSIKSESKQLWTVEDSKHTEMWIEYNKEYRDRVTTLLDMVENK